MPIIVTLSVNRIKGGRKIRRITHGLQVVTCFLAAAGMAAASDVVEVLPLTRQVLMVHYDDGHAVYHQKGQPRTSESLVIDKLDTASAARASSYTLSSTGDANYATARAPSTVHRKTQGTEFINTNDVRNSFAQEHWLYLTLPSPMQSGSGYTLSTGSLAKNGSTWTFTYDEKALRSEAVHVNLIGYSTLAPEKYAYLYHWMGNGGGLDLADRAGAKFWVCDSASRTPVFEGTIAFRQTATYADFAYPTDSKNGNLLYAAVWECDFSAFNTPGTYVVAAEGIGCSFPFRIGADVLREPFTNVMKAVFRQRSGIALTADHTDYPRAAHARFPTCGAVNSAPRRPPWGRGKTFTTSGSCRAKIRSSPTGTTEKARLPTGMFRMARILPTLISFPPARIPPPGIGLLDLSRRID